MLEPPEASSEARGLAVASGLYPDQRQGSGESGADSLNGQTEKGEVRQDVNLDTGAIRREDAPMTPVGSGAVETTSNEQRPLVVSSASVEPESPARPRSPGSKPASAGPTAVKKKPAAAGTKRRAAKADDDDGEGRTCDRCGKYCSSAVALAGHRRFCDGGAWRCDWCKCKADECSGKNPGPRGRSTLCGACGSRYRAGHIGPVVPNERGKYECEACGKELDSIGALGGHRRFCDGGAWRCDWCKCSASQCSGKNPGPRGPATLCGACGSRYRAGHTGPPKTTEDGKFVCETCGKLLDSIGALGGHRRFCDGGQWRCAWCRCSAQQCSGKNPGPDGPATLCGACGSRYRAGHSGPPRQNESGKYVCEACGKALESIVALGGHRRFCDGGNWRCNWCGRKADATSSKTAGPDGAGTLCGACGSRYRSGHDGPAVLTNDGKYACEACGKLLDSIIALGGHRRFCDGRLAALVYDDGAEWLGGRRGDPLPCPLAGDFAKAQKQADEQQGRDDAVSAAKTQGNTAARRSPENGTEISKSDEKIALPGKPKMILNGRDAGPVIEAWDLARHIARRRYSISVEDRSVLDSVAELDAAANLPGKWWEDVAPGRLAREDGWSWTEYVDAILSHNDGNTSFSDFHELYALVTATLLQSDTSAADPEAVAGQRRKKFWLTVNADNWIDKLADAFPDHEVAGHAATASERYGARWSDHKNGKESSQRRTSAALFAMLGLDERLELVQAVTGLALSTSVVRDHVNEVAQRLDRVATLKREEWARRKALTESAADLLGAEPPRVDLHGTDRAVRVVSDAFTSAPLRRKRKSMEATTGIAEDDENALTGQQQEQQTSPSSGGAVPKKRGRDDDEPPSASAMKLNRAKWLRQAHDQQRRELDDKFAALRSKLGSYRRLCLGSDRDGRIYYVLGDVWDRVFVATGNVADQSSQDFSLAWFWLDPNDASDLRKSLCPKRECKLSRILDRILPTLMKNGKSISSSSSNPSA